MPDAASVWAALQAIGVVGILMVCLWAVSRGAYIPRASHDEVLEEQGKLLAELHREIERLQNQLDRYEFRYGPPSAQGELDRKPPPVE